MIPIVSAKLDGLRRRYGEPHRAYHGQSHIDAMLRGLREEAAWIRHPDAVALAIWYHDAIYDPSSTDNEARSAELLRVELDGLVGPATLQMADLMIRATADHLIPEHLPEEMRQDVAIFLDLDLAVLGADAADYDAYETGIAAEFEPVHGAGVFRLGRAGFLRDLLARDRLFHTDRFHQALDEAARVNLRRALEHLTTGP